MLGVIWPLKKYAVFKGLKWSCLFPPVNSAWLPSPEKMDPPDHYFCTTKLKAWANTADQVQEACSDTKQLIGRYFEQKHRDIVAQLVGRCL